MTKIFSRLIRGISQNKKKTLYLEEDINRIERIEKILGTKVNDCQLYLEALTHRSSTILKNSKAKFHSNERLEFLGDSVLNLVIGEIIFNKYKKEDEGFLTKLRSRFVNRDILANTAEKLRIHDLMFLSENASISLRRGAKSIVSDAVEALIGAIYLDQGLESAKKFVHKNIFRPNKNLLSGSEDKNYKSRLLEYTQAKKLPTPNYTVYSEEGPQHSRIFTIDVFIGEKNYGRGTGPTKKAAEQIAALKALEKLRLV